MSLSVLATKYGGEILYAEHVNKSFPTFFHELSALGAKVNIHDTEHK
jgi:5-enolpyruvylshikimate-3-phosphate synthase